MRKECMQNCLFSFYTFSFNLIAERDLRPKIELSNCTFIELQLFWPTASVITDIKYLNGLS